MAVTEEQDEQEQNPQVWMEPSHIVSDAYKSLDKQIDELDKIPEKAKTACNNLLAHVTKQELFSLEGQVKTYQVLQDTDEELGHCIDAVMEIERERFVPEKERLQVPQMPQLPNMEPPEKQMAQPVTVQGQPIIRTSFLSELARGRSQNKLMEKMLQFQREQLNRPEITTSKIKEILDYGKELIPEYNKLYDFYDQGIKRVSFFNDPETVWNQRREIVNEVAKITGVIRAFSRAVVEYRKERFGDRKVGVAAGAMWLEAAKANMIATGRGGIIATSAGGISETIVRKPRGGPYPSTMSSGVNEQSHE